MLLSAARRDVSFLFLVLVVLGVSSASWGMSFVDRRVPIFAAAADGDLKQLREMLDRNPELLEFKGPFGITPLIVAAGQGQVAAVGLLLDRGADIRASSVVDGTALHAAAAAGQTDVVRLLIKRGAVVGAKGMPRSETPLHLAAAQGDVNIVKMLLEADAPVNVKTEQLRETPLMAAAAAGHADVVQLLLEKGASSDERNYEGQTAMSLAAKAGHEDVVAVLVAKGAGADDALGQPPLTAEELKDPKKVEERSTAVSLATHDIFSAASAGDLDRIKKYVSLLPKVVNTRGPRAQSVLQCAIAGKSIEAVKFLLDHGAKLDEFVSPVEGGPMNWAVASGSKQMVELLLARNVSLNGSDERFGPRQTPLNTAVVAGNVEMVKFLLDKGADVHDVSWPYVTPLDTAAQAGNIPIAEALLDAHADINGGNDPRSRSTPLLAAAQSRQNKMVEFLLDRGADAKKASRWGSLVDVAARTRNQELLAVLSKRGFAMTLTAYIAQGDLPAIKAFLQKDPAAVKSTDGFGNTPLHLAAQVGQVEAAKVLLDAGADVNARNSMNETPLQAAASGIGGGGSEDLVRLLLDKGADVNARDQMGRTPLDGPITNSAIRDLLKQRGGKQTSELGPLPPDQRFPRRAAPQSRPATTSPVSFRHVKLVAPPPPPGPGSININGIALGPGGKIVQGKDHITWTYGNEDGKLAMTTTVEEGSLQIVAVSIGGGPARFTVETTSGGKTTTREYPTEAALRENDPQAMKVFEKYDRPWAR